MKVKKRRDREVKRLWAWLILSFLIRVRREAGLSASLLDCTLNDGRMGPVEGGEASHPSFEMECQALVHSRDKLEVTQQSLTLMEDDLKDRSIFSFICHVLDFR